MKPSTVSSLIFPLRCPSCDKIADTGYPLCTSCRKLMLHRAEGKRSCSICNMSTAECICKERQYYDRLVVPLYYENPVKRTLRRFKFRGRRDLAKQYARLLALSLEERNLPEKTDIITCIPMSRTDIFLRGYNQSQLIAKQLSKITGLPFRKLLYKKYRTKKQHRLTREARSGNLLGVFEPCRNMTEIIDGRTILVIDDIITTGSTLNEISKTLLIFGADKVFVSACAATKMKKNH